MASINFNESENVEKSLMHRLARLTVDYGWTSEQAGAIYGEIELEAAGASRPISSVIILVGDEIKRISDATVLQCHVAQSCHLDCIRIKLPNRCSLDVFICQDSLWQKVNKNPDIKDWEVENSLCQLEGTDKQIDWARVLRQKQLPDLLAEVWTINDNYNEMKEYLKKFLQTQKKSSFWIEMRTESPRTVLANLIKEYQSAPSLDALAKEALTVPKTKAEAVDFLFDKVSKHQNKYRTFHGQAYYDAVLARVESKHAEDESGAISYLIYAANNIREAKAALRSEIVRSL